MVEKIENRFSLKSVPEVLRRGFVDSDKSKTESYKDLANSSTGIKELETIISDRIEKTKEASIYIEDRNPYSMSSRKPIAWSHYKNGRILLDEYRDTTARIVEILTASDHWIRNYEDKELETVGLAIKTTSYDPSTPEWLNSRMHTLGGSDIGTIAVYDESLVKKTKFASFYEEHYLNLCDAKSSPEEVTERNLATEGPLFRGTVMEDFIRKQAAQKFSSVVNTKSQYLGKDWWQQVNFDGIFMNSESLPEGILEIKNVSSVGTWNESIPTQYRAQILNYLDATGLNYARIYAVADDYNVFTSVVYRDEEIFSGSGKFSEYRKNRIEPWIEEYLSRS